MAATALASQSRARARLKTPHAARARVMSTT
jgi:hypothetical protein